MDAHPFLTPVSAYGLPHRILPIAREQPALLGPLSASTVADLYWRLRSLTISHGYTISGLGSFSRTFTLTCLREPMERLITGESYEQEAIDPSDGRLTVFHFDTSALYYSPNGVLSYGLQLSESSYPDRDISLSLGLESASKLLDSLTFTFCGIPLTAHLQSTQDSLSGSIDHCSILPDFWQFS
jgi:hypothetical protein